MHARIAWLALLFGCNSGARDGAAPDAATPAPREVAPSARASAVPMGDGPADRAAAAGAKTSAPTASEAGERTWRFVDPELGEMVVVVQIPKTDVPLPVLITMHGLGESEKGPERGARGWSDDYALPRAIARLAAPPLLPADLERLASASRLAALNASLETEPYRGLVIVTPYTPNILAGDRSLEAARPLARFLVDEVLPRVKRETPAIGTPATTGIDGVSLGGRAALLVGFTRPEAFAAVGSLQAAVYGHEIDTLTRLAREARAKNPALRLRLLTSGGDFYRGTIERLSSRWKSAGIDHQLDVVDGPHGYSFNRGPGAYEMLLFHDRALRGGDPLR